MARRELSARTPKGSRLTLHEVYSLRVSYADRSSTSIKASRRPGCRRRRSRAGGHLNRWRACRPRSRQGRRPVRRAEPERGQPGAEAIAAQIGEGGEGGDEGEEEDQDRPGEAVRGQLQAPLGHVSEAPSPPASSTERVRWALAPVRRSARAGRARTATGAAITSHVVRRRPAVTTAAATATPIGKTIAAPTSAPKRPTAKTIALSRPTARKTAARRPGGGAARNPRGRHRFRRRRGPKQRLELVADPVEAHAEPRVGAEQGERGERRAGDHVDREGADDQSRGDRKRPQPADRKRVIAASRGAPNITKSCSVSWPGSTAAAASKSSGR